MKNKLDIIKWSARTIAIFSFLFGLPFYLGYWNPLPFVNPDYTLFDNIWLTSFPFIFVGLVLGIKYEKIGGFLIVVPIVLSCLIWFISIWESFPWPMFIPLLAWILYLVYWYKKDA